MPDRLAVIATVVMAAAIPSAAAENAAIRAERLSEFVRQDCGSCHGLTLKGGLGSALTPERLAGYDAAALAAVILFGIEGTAMPAWQGMLSEGEAAWIARALKEGRIR